MKTALIIVKRPTIILPPLAEKCKECYSIFQRDWTCVIDYGDVIFHHNLKCDLLVRRTEPDIKEYAIKLAKAEGKCNRIVIVNFGDCCADDYSDLIKTNSIGISHTCDEYGNVIEDKPFIQRDSFICISCDCPGDISIDPQLNIFIGKPATQDDLDHYNLDPK